MPAVYLCTAAFYAWPPCGWLTRLVMASLPTSQSLWHDTAITSLEACTGLHCGGAGSASASAQPVVIYNAQNGGSGTPNGLVAPHRQILTTMHLWVMHTHT
jgi:hypothetical protein